MIGRILIFGGVILGLLVLAVGVFLAYRYYANRNISDTKNLEEIVEKTGNKYVNENGNVGLVIGIVKDNKIYIKGFGATSKENGTVPDSKTIFEIASTGKTFTTSVAQILNDRGELSLDDTIDKYLKGKTKLCAKAEKITLRQLATHTSGFPSFPESFVSKIKDELNPYKDLVTQDLYHYLGNCEDFGDSGVYQYSNLGMGILGHILELKTGKSYEQLVKDELTEKLGMSNTTITLDDSQRKKLAQGYNDKGEPNPVWEDNVLTGAGSFLSNAEDMIKFIKANLDETQSEISKNLLKTHERQFGGETGLGWHHHSNFVGFITDEKETIWHNGAAGGYVSFAAVNKKTKSGVIILSNSANDVTTLGIKLHFLAGRISLANN